MAKMLGKLRFWGCFCTCCVEPRKNKHSRAIEKRQWKKEVDKQ